MLVEQAPLEFLERVRYSDNIIVYGFSVVRKELRDTPKHLKHARKSFRNILLSFYDSVVGKHGLLFTSVIGLLLKNTQ